MKKTWGRKWKVKLSEEKWKTEILIERKKRSVELGLKKKLSENFWNVKIIKWMKKVKNRTQIHTKKNTEEIKKEN